MQIKIKYLITVLSLISCFSCASLKTTKNVNRVFENSPAFKQGFAGLVIYDPESNKTIFDKNGDKYFTPASNTKLFTFYTALKIIGDSIPSIKYTIYGDSLIFKGTGDPGFLYADFNSEKTLDFLRNSDKKLFLLSSNFTESKFGPGWAWDDYNSYYSAERNALPLYGNIVQFEFKKDQNSSKSFPDVFDDSISTEKTKSLGAGVYRDIDSNIFRYKSEKRTEASTRSVPFITSAYTSAKLLSDTLRKEVMILPQKPKNIDLDHTICNEASDSLYKKMLQESDNFIAEQLLLVSAGIISDTLETDIAIDYAQENLLNDLPDKINWHDGSGLTRYNLFTPRSVVKLISKITEEIGEDKFKSLLPAGGESGTLKNYYKSDKAYIYAKTGTLRNNHSLSGLLITKSGKTLYFSFMNSNYTVPTSQLKQAMEEILTTVRDQY
ncbi:D-alanyl-D-alanine carboxypeptidase / D-alanyl-D-alanine-endopeptidase (penicillin-binding protein 4) [Zunongwangia mangrovi]|uniref:D-alanyl-D-alanine carboxypeptidase / D-alanyl-D-alanine-endopeptidase (Penicillin-binding protein 4) n=1 Tax=Zunongwangia mangrovi TaxID=1334022 RepID=A0A1I1K1P7_9FLAO|nr:D-alanyl-D-alanine carboxypeptidase [Zunongwangia mangrovi]SFC52678.1 D-alanyl-D-alanine carboxypeptidase / D-alanyl-D-alanine-endopeptidase (penicillin-binding protein 4) [Zunongwangia mangrovi]